METSWTLFWNSPTSEALYQVMDALTMKYRGGWPRLVQLFSRLRHILWSTHHAAMRVKGNMYCAIVIPTFLYGAETWTLYRRQEKHSTSAFDHADKLYGQCDKQGHTQTDRDAIYGRSSAQKEFPLQRGFSTLNCILVTGGEGAQVSGSRIPPRET